MSSSKLKDSKAKKLSFSGRLKFRSLGCDEVWPISNGDSLGFYDNPINSIFCDTGKAVTDIAISLKSYLKVDNPGEAIILKAQTKYIFIQ